MDPPPPGSTIRQAVRRRPAWPLGMQDMIVTRRVRRDLIGVAGIGVLLCAGAGHLEARQQPDPAVLQQHATEGERALAEGRYADAEKAYETLRQLSPATAEVQARLGLIYFQEGKFGDAIAPLREALRLKPGLPKVDALLAMSLSELGKLRRGAARVDEGLLAAHRRRAAAHVRTPPAARSIRDSAGIWTPLTSRSACRASTPTTRRCCITPPGCLRTTPTCRR